LVVLNPALVYGRTLVCAAHFQQVADALSAGQQQDSNAALKQLEHDGIEVRRLVGACTKTCSEAYSEGKQNEGVIVVSEEGNNTPCSAPCCYLCPPFYLIFSLHGVTDSFMKLGIPVRSTGLATWRKERDGVDAFSGTGVRRGRGAGEELTLSAGLVARGVVMPPERGLHDSFVALSSTR
jgi:hypothetical protein